MPIGGPPRVARPAAAAPGVTSGCPEGPPPVRLAHLLSPTRGRQRRPARCVVPRAAQQVHPPGPAPLTPRLTRTPTVEPRGSTVLPIRRNAVRESIDAGRDLTETGGAGGGEYPVTAATSSRQPDHPRRGGGTPGAAGPRGRPVAVAPPEQTLAQHLVGRERPPVSIPEAPVRVLRLVPQEQPVSALVAARLPRPAQVAALPPRAVAPGLTQRRRSSHAVPRPRRACAPQP